MTTPRNNCSKQMNGRDTQIKRITAYLLQCPEVTNK